MMKECPHWERCSAPVCPLDPDWGNRRVLNDDPTCYYLLESVKANAEARFKRLGWDKFYQMMVSTAPALSSRWGRIKRRLEDARKSGSRMGTIPPNNNSALRHHQSLVATLTSEAE